MNKFTLRLIALFLVLMCLVSCGQTGSLYLPPAVKKAAASKPME